MIISKLVKIKMCGANKSILLENGYKYEHNKEIDVPISILSKNSHYKIEVKCDVCKNEKKLSYKKYNKNIENGGYYACSSKCSQSKIKNTNLNKYGVEYPSQSKKIREKTIETFYKNYGYDNPMKNKTIRNKFEKTMLERYGVKHSFESEEINSKIRETMLEKYGTISPFSSKEIRYKAKKTINRKYNCENVFQNEKIKEKISITNIEKYGFKSSSMNDDIKKTIVKSNRKSFGYDYAAQNPEIFKKMLMTSFKIKEYENNNIYYQGSYEKDFLDTYYNKIKITKVKPIEYIFNSKKKFYHADFYLPDYNLIVEIKSNYTYNYNIYMNISKKDACLNLGYNFLFIIDKNYSKFNKIICEK